MSFLGIFSLYPLFQSHQIRQGKSYEKLIFFVFCVNLHRKTPVFRLPLPY